MAAFGPTSSAVQSRNSISGVVSDSQYRPINRLRIELLDEVEMRIKQTYTDAGGRYSFNNLSSGTFIVRVNSDGVYATQSVRVTLYVARAGSGSHYEQVDIRMKTIEETRPSSIPANKGSTFAQEVPENARKAYNRAVKQFEANQIDQAVASLKEALRLFPTYFVALERLGVEQVKAQQYDQARATLLKAKEVNPNGAASLYALGVSHFYLQELTDAAETLRKSLLLAPESANAPLSHFYLGLAYWNLGKPAEAEPHLKKAYQTGGNTVPPDIHMHLAKYYSDNKRYKEAAEELEMFLKNAPDARDAEKIKSLIKQLREKMQNGTPTSKG
jgi:tetratricopeptide (TPR) repeat protein